ncbi:DUF397 domain-containing protein [Glycomyces sp. NPDC047010]|uniref:DUF397 domain-containing protein n=1 Tax=Glycomyces sp. NPDC047010 TaxID=3155023 RepID=UPI0033FEC9A7
MTTSKWRKSSRSGADQTSSNCVEARAAGSRFEVRDSKLSEDSPVFGLTQGDFTALLGTAQR